jgi:putative oxidoreductase
MAAFMKPYSAQTYAVMRIIIGLLFMSHGLAKITGWPPSPLMPPEPPPPAFMYSVGSLELVLGLLVATGFYTRWAAFLASGMMAVAYWSAHGLNAFHPISNMGELAVMYCFVFLYISAHGAGIWSVDGER